MDAKMRTRIARAIVHALRSASYERRTSLPWRKTRSPYKILVSEVMLQQTQVERVVPFYTAFIKKYPSARTLARARLRDVLRAWQGLGYNRRAKFLHDAAKTLVGVCDGRFPRTTEGIETLPGVGHYTARAVATFAFDAPEAFVETNIRTVIFRHLPLPQGRFLLKMGDKELLVVVEEALVLSKMRPREFYAAMMDYGAHLKRTGVKLNHRSTHYAKQSKFDGSRRQLRGQVLRLLLAKPATVHEIMLHHSERTDHEVKDVLERLAHENLICTKRGVYSINQS